MRLTERQLIMSKIVLIDGHSILNRAFFGLPDLTNAEGLYETSYSYDAYGNLSVSGNTEIQNPYTYNAEYTDASTGNQYLRARYYDPEEGTFLTQDSYFGSLLEPLS